MRDERQQKMVEEFIVAVESILGVKRTNISLEEEWSRTGPEPHRQKTLLQYLDKVIICPFTESLYLLCVSRSTGRITMTATTDTTNFEPIIKRDLVTLLIQVHS